MAKEIVKTDRPAPLNNPTERAYHKPLPKPIEEITPVDFDTMPIFIGLYVGKQELVTAPYVPAIPASGGDDPSHPEYNPGTPEQPEKVEEFHIFVFNSKKFAVRTDEPTFATVNEAMSRIRPGSCLVEIEYLGDTDETTKRGRFEVSEHK